jgi:hypothetical protein
MIAYSNTNNDSTTYGGCTTTGTADYNENDDISVSMTTTYIRDEFSSISSQNSSYQHQLEELEKQIKFETKLYDCQWIMRYGSRTNFNMPNHFYGRKNFNLKILRCNRKGIGLRMKNAKSAKKICRKTRTFIKRK